MGGAGMRNWAAAGDRIAGLVLVAMAALVLWESRALPLGTISSPGPAFMPIALALVVLAGRLNDNAGSQSWTDLFFVILLIFVPWLGALIYLIARGHSMGERQMAAMAQAQAQQERYIKSVAAQSASPAEQIASAKRLLDSGVSLQQIRTAVEHLRERGVEDLSKITLMSDGA